MNPNEGYGTHIPILARAFLRTGGPVLECGIGWHSTPLLHFLCHDANRSLCSLDHDAEWIAHFDPFRADWHRFIHAPLGITSDLAKDLRRQDWGLALIDHAPSDDRLNAMEQLLDHVQIFVVHDTEDPKFYEPAFSRFAYRADFTFLRPFTSILSNTIDITGWTQ